MMGSFPVRGVRTDDLPGRLEGRFMTGKLRSIKDQNRSARWRISSIRLRGPCADEGGFVQLQAFPGMT